MHTNRSIEEQPGVKVNVRLKDSEARVARISELVKAAEPDFASIRHILPMGMDIPYLLIVNERMKAQLQHCSA